MKKYFNIEKLIIVSGGEIYRTTDNLVVFEPHPELQSQNIEELNENFKAYKALLKGHKLPLLIDISNLERIKSKEKNLVRNTISVFSSVAFITNKSVSRVILNVFLQFHKREPQIKMFSTVQEAKKWSLQFTNQNKVVE